MHKKIFHAIMKLEELTLKLKKRTICHTQKIKALSANNRN